MSDREDRLRSLLNKVRAKRPDERETHAADVIERIRTASGAVPAAQPVVPEPPIPASSRPAPGPSSVPVRSSSHPAHEPPTSPTVESPTRYSSQPPRVERPLSVEPRARSGGPQSSQPARPAPTDPGRPESIRALSAASTGQPVVYATDAPEFPRPKTFGDLLELTLSLRPR